MRRGESETQVVGCRLPVAGFGKRGSGHFEMIVGFIFFIGFVLFLFLFISPWSSSSLPKTALEGLYDSFFDEVKTNLSSVFVKADVSASGCYEIDLPEDLFKYAVTGEKSRVTLLGGTKIDSQVDDDDLVFRATGPDDDFFRVAISKEFEDGLSGVCTSISDPELGGIVELEVVSNESLTVMKEEYETDYEGLKSRLKLADIFEFSIEFVDSDIYDMNPLSGVPDGAEVLAREYPVKILSSDGAVSNERVSIKIW